MNGLTGLVDMSEASAAHTTNYDKSVDSDYAPRVATYEAPKVEAQPASHKAIPVSLLEALIHANHFGVPRPEEPPSVQFKVGLIQVLRSLNAISTCDPTVTVPSPRSTATDNLVNDLAIENCKRILAVRSDANQLKNITNNLGVCITSPKMAGRLPVLSTTNLPRATPEEQSATASPARGTAMLNSIFKSVRVPEFRFKWMFWAEKGQQSTPKDKAANSEEYASRPKPLGEQIISVKEFYQHFNNIPVENLKLRDSIHLFHLGVKPVWEDPRNARGGAWYFKISKDIASQFWHEMCLLAVGDILQSAIETKRDCKPRLFPPTIDSPSLVRIHN